MLKYNIIFKETISNHIIDDFLKRYYNYNESKISLQKLSEYHKSYNDFFCIPFLKNFDLRKLNQNYCENKEFYENK